MSIQPAQWQWDESGVPRSIAFDDIYHSRSGGIAQAKDVFVRGSGFPERWSVGQCCTILETGFGLGLNFLTTWRSWKEAGCPGTLHYLALECHPLQSADLAHIWDAYPELKEETYELLAQWVFPMRGFHRLVFEKGRVVLTLALGDVRDIMPEWVARVDAFYLDGFSPDRNPEMWDVALFKRCARLAVPGCTTIATYTVAGSVRRALTEAGFIVERVEGFGGKRHRLVGVYQGFGRLTRSASAFSRLPIKRPTHVAVIGAGIAGCSVAERLALRGINVELFDTHPGPAHQTSGNRAGVIAPLLSKDNSFSERISRAAYLWWQGQRKHWMAYGLVGGFPGVMQLALSVADVDRQRVAIAAHAFPAEYANFLDAECASEHIGYKVELPGWWFPQGGWINPPSLCQAMINAAGKYVRPHWNTRVERIQPNASNGWSIETAGESFFVDQVILANAWESSSLLPEGALTFRRIRGQASTLGCESLPYLRVVVSQAGYVVPPISGYGVMGATFEWEDVEPLSEAEVHISNAFRIQQMFPSLPLSGFMGVENRMGWRTSTLDRLPMVGSLAPFWGDSGAGLWGLLGLGSRGLVWAPWAAEVLASACCGEPLPLECNLWEALDPYRFELRKRRCAKRM